MYPTMHLFFLYLIPQCIRLWYFAIRDKPYGCPRDEIFRTSQKSLLQVAVSDQITLLFLCTKNMIFMYKKKKLEKVYFMSQILVHEYWTILDHFLHSGIVSFWLTPACSKERKYNIFRQYWNTRNVPVFTNTGTFQYLEPEVYFFQKFLCIRNRAVIDSLC